MARTRTIRGVSTQGDTPEWGPLLALIGEQLTGDFMWMFEVTLANGTKLQAYKHYYTRCYVHLDPDGGAYVYERPSRYRPYPVADVLAAVFLPLERRLNGVTDEQIARSWAAVERLEGAADRSQA
jgi:hypothetical protein